jgi:hypothetical protein
MTTLVVLSICFVALPLLLCALVVGWVLWLDWRARRSSRQMADAMRAQQVENGKAEKLP